MREYRAVLTHPSVQSRFPHLSARRVALALYRLRFVADECRTQGVTFEFPRDPLDAKFIELAIAGRATHIVTLDGNLLSLKASRGRGFASASRRSPC